MAPTPTAAARAATVASSTAAEVDPLAPADPANAARTPSTLNDETQLLWEADRALRAGDGVRAVNLLDEHAARFPEGALSPERGAERVVALCKLGRADAAAVRAYLAAHPNASLTERIQQSCARILARGR
jgi:RNA polymerase sigma-70 factor (ECF subfamily)